MAPQKFNSVRIRNRPTSVRVAPFKDDTTLKAFRYEHTVQAELPIPIVPIPPRNPARKARSSSTITTNSSTVVVPPPPSAQPERSHHPAFRRRSSIAPIAEDSKRDSGLAGTVSSTTTTIREESGEEDAFGRTVTTTTTTDQSSFLSFDGQSFTSLEAVASVAATKNWDSLWEDPRPAPPSPPRPNRTTSDGRTTQERSLRRGLGVRSSLIDIVNPPRKLQNKPSMDEATMASGSTDGGVDDSPKSTSPKMPELDSRGKEAGPANTAGGEFTPINTTIPTERLIDDELLTDLTFSKRGSLLLGGKRSFGLIPSFMDGSSDRAVRRAADSVPNSDPDEMTATATVTATDESTKPPLPSIRVLSLDVERESQKVRSLYESGDGLNWEDGRPPSSAGRRLEPTEEVPSPEAENAASHSSAAGGDPPNPQPSPSTNTTTTTTTERPPPERSPSANTLSPQPEFDVVRSKYELAGGIEDWEDVDGADVDRYGFISPKRPQSRASSTPESGPGLLTPRKRNVLVKRPGSAGYLSSPLAGGRTPSRKVSARSLYTQNSERSTASRRSVRSSIRNATNLLPHNHDRKCIDDAGEMLSLAPGLADIAEDDHKDKASVSRTNKEVERSEKWRKMANVTTKGQDGPGTEGTRYDFDIKNPKLIERTWKGIPDPWRAAAWQSFLATSAKRAGSTLTDEHFISEFHRLQPISSPDDVQIDLDVPRTINRHIMFRKRYRGGQRLLFRVLHATSLYFPDTGYVQGMASLAATLLCYYDEERSFMMLARMFQHRGLERLYEPGFAGLMTALSDFEKHWLGNKHVSRKLSELCINPTAYATRWYLTLFNLSLPFSAQLRVWDVFMLLGGSPPPTSSQNPEVACKQGSDAPFLGLDIVHATSAAIIHALREVLLDSDFENAMKALTSWVVKDEEMLMKVTRAAWKRHQGRRKA